jgi:AcrR family transcriptional regulator
MTTHQRGERAQTLARRQEIVAAGLTAFSSSGFHGTSLRDVAGRAGLSQAGLLHHFRSKEHLLKAVLAWRDDEARRQLGEPAPHGLDLIRRLIARSSATGTREFVRLDVIVSAEGTAADYPVHDYVRERQTAAHEVVRAAFERAAAHGGLRRDVDCAAAARTLTALMAGLQVQWLLDPADADIEGDLSRCLQPWLAPAAE